MFARIFAYELKKNVCSVSFLLFAAIYFLMTWMFAANRDPNSVFLMVQMGKEFHNAPIIIGRSIGVLSAFGILVTMVMVGRSVARDYITRTHSFFFTTPLSRSAFLGGRFWGSLTANLLLFVFALLGYVAGCLMAGPDFYGPFRWDAFVMPLLVVVIPNILLAGSLMFAVATLTRRMVFTYITGVVLLTVYMSVTGALTQLDSDLVRILADPFGHSALGILSRNWTVADINANSLPLSGAFLLNRAIWTAVALLALGITWSRFRFHSHLETRKTRRLEEAAAEPRPSVAARISPELDHSARAQWRKGLHLMLRDSRRILLHPAFIILMIMSVSTVLSNFLFNVAMTGNRVIPFTSWYMSQISEMGWVFFVPITVLFGGMLVWKERDNGSHGFHDTLPVPDWMSMISKLLTLMAVQLAYVALLALSGIFTQVVVLGYTDVEPWLYIRQLFGMEWMLYIHMAIIVMTIQNLMTNKVLGFFVSTLWFVADLILFTFLKVDLPFLRYGFWPTFIYSNLNGFGHFSVLLFWYGLMWLLLGAILVWINTLIWRRDNETSLKFRIQRARQQWTRTHSLGLGILTLLLAAVFSFILINRYSINSYLSNRALCFMRADYEKKYSQYETLPQPEIAHVSVKVDFYPENRDAFIRGRYDMVNRTGQPVEEVIVNLSSQKLSAVHRLNFSQPADLLEYGDEFGFRRFRLETPLGPGDSLSLFFDVEAVTRGFTDNYPNNELAYNGSCLNLSMFELPWYFPSVGYNGEYRLTSKYRREKCGLKDLPPVPALGSGNETHSFIGSQFVTYEAVIGTSGDQVPFSNGDRLEAWTENGRNYARFRVDQPHSLEFVLASGRYAVHKALWRDKTIEVFYHPKHAYNIDRIVRGVKAGLAYGSDYYKPYAHQTVRVLEMPDYMAVGGARSFSSAMTWRESAGFITRIREGDVDNVVRIAAHEMAHHWWACEVVPAEVEGFYLLSESLADYTACMALQKEYGQKMALQLIDDEMNTYLRRRKRDLRGERPIYRGLSGQSYLGYQKGLCVFYALQEYIGEARLNRALQAVVNTWAGRRDRYPTSLDLMDELAAVTPDSLNYLLDDWFKKITIYDCRAEKAHVTPLADGRFQVDLDVGFAKFYADSIGVETKAAPHDHVPIGVLGEEGEPLYYALHHITSDLTHFQIVVDEKPVRAGIDPLGVLIDKNRRNNVMTIH